MRWLRATGLVAAASLALGCSMPADTPEDRASDRPGGRAGEQTVRTDTRLEGSRVLVVSVDALTSGAIRRLGPEGTPHLHRLLREGAATLDARTAYESTSTLPNHTGMVTGRRVDADRGGHGVTFNTHVPGSRVQEAAGHPVASIFSRVHRAGGGSALFATERKFSIFARSWPTALDRVVIRQDDDAAVALAARRDLLRRDRSLTFVHLGEVDVVGHARGGMSPAYLRAVRRADTRIGGFLSVLDRTSGRASRTVLVLTADHGTRGRQHDDPTVRANFQVPFVVWGPGVRRGDLYADPDDRYVPPGRRRPTYAGRQPVRNGDVANLVASLLGLDRVPGSEFGARGTVPWRDR